MTGAEMIAAERKRQVDEEGWTSGHDAEHDDAELLGAATAYAIDVLAEWNKGTYLHDDFKQHVGTLWPWDKKRWKPTPKDPVRQLVKAGALIAAEIDRLLTQQNVSADWEKGCGCDKPDPIWNNTHCGKCGCPIRR